MPSCRASSLADFAAAIASSSAKGLLIMYRYKQNLEFNASDNYVDGNSASKPFISMAKSDLHIKVGAAIRTARKRRGMVQRQIADALEIKVAAVGMWESGQNLPSTSNLIKTAEALRVDASALGKGEVVYLDDEPLADAEIITEPSPPPFGPMDIKMMGVAYGGDDGDFSFNGEIAGYVRRPPGIASIPNVFALHVLSDSMVPRYDPGEIIYCGGRAPVPGDHIVVEMHTEAEGEVGKAFVKKLIKRTEREVVVEQYNPPRTISFDRSKVKHLWRVIPLKELIGF